ncbi:hypothetical protein DACRYDRAFT_22728 [Dacryopinax primogenitus]|uniref:Uncharacterized protein n=1 Tax=Dacryopinax primogenitus (strain DJM 731) TaxID=1858805 RepID=M5GCB9_DACPD|nr:uncharacterized protein DACRYDRAFT_22728 [Dacryopinax primogenitus]EJU01678.1 hypothetical protein DACRYDRAFT_22728 [Dacryopinax primogenitus]
MIIKDTDDKGEVKTEKPLPASPDSVSSSSEDGLPSYYEAQRNQAGPSNPRRQRPSPAPITTKPRTVSTFSSLSVSTRKNLADKLAYLTTRTPTTPSKSSWVPGFVRKRSEAKQQAQIDEQVKETVLTLIRDVVRDVQQPDCIDILNRCVAACQMRALMFPELAQLKIIEDHTALYWAIVSGTPTTASTLPTLIHPVVNLLISFPLQQHTRIDARQACTVNSDNRLFQQLRQSPGYSTIVTYANEVISAGGDRLETVEVNHMNLDAVGQFAISFSIQNWIRKMRAAKHVPLEFIARGRTWGLTFRVAEEHTHGFRSGQWYGELKLLDNSPPTWVTGRLRIMPQDVSFTRKGPLDITFHTEGQRLDNRWALQFKLKGPKGELVEFDDSPYLTQDGTMHVQGEFKLDKTHADCVIM